MTTLTRREFGASALLLGSGLRLRAASAGIDQSLRQAVEQKKVPAVVGMVATPDRILYSGAFGVRDQASATPVKTDALFAIASMTKAVASSAAMQLVEQGKVALEEPVSKHLPELANLQVLAGFDASGKPQLRPASKPVTLRHLLTHTSGFAYDNWDGEMFKYGQHAEIPAVASGKPSPLAFEPGLRWQYGTGVDWAGRLVERISGLNLEQYMVKNIFEPLGMHDSKYSVPQEKFDRLVSNWQKQPDGSIKENPRALPPVPKSFGGGGGLYSTVSDYTRFMQMILRRGSGPGGEKILQAKTVDQMASNQVGPIVAGRLKTYKPSLSADVDFHPGFEDKFGLGFLINTTGYQGGRSAGSLAWAGIFNTFYWIDPQKKLCGVVMMQFLPFVDPSAVAVLKDFERAVYRSTQS